jgi:hypothetical protein
VATNRPILPALDYYDGEIGGMMTGKGYQSSQYVVPRGGIFLGKWRSSFAGNFVGKMNVQSACTLNTRLSIWFSYWQVFHCHLSCTI